MGFLCVDLNNINLDNVNFYEDCPETIIHVRLLAWCNIFQLCKTFQKELSKECSMDWSMSKDEKKETYFWLMKSSIKFGGNKNAIVYKTRLLAFHDLTLSKKLIVQSNLFKRPPL